MYAASIGGLWRIDYLYVAGFCTLIAAVSLHRSKYRLRWPAGLYRSLGSNLGFWLGNALFAPAVFIFHNAIKAAFDDLGLPHLDEAIWADLPVWLLAIIAVLMVDFADYWTHRAIHHKWLWPMHAVHHSDKHVNPLTTYRVHFLEPLCMRISYLLILSWFGLPADAAGFGAIFLTLLNIYVHTTIDWGHGPLRHVIASPRLHQWHHANVPEAQNKNLANVFPFYDVLFGTYYNPGPCTAAFGCDGVPDNSFVKLTLYPFQQWSKALITLIDPRSSAKAQRSTGS
ncbi:MAG: sterol desaturase family protein [Pseudomonadota bacterium]